MHMPDEIASNLLGIPYAELDERSQKVARHVAGRKHLARNLAKDFDARPTFGQRASDAAAGFGGSWTFVGLFGAARVGLNAFMLWSRGKTFDPFPYILLNLFLSTLAAVQAPIILMSQNRQSQKDRIAAEHDYEVNLKAELEIMLLHEKIDLLRQTQWEELLTMQKEQLKLLAPRLASLPGRQREGALSRFHRVAGDAVLRRRVPGAANRASSQQFMEFADPRCCRAPRQRCRSTPTRAAVSLRWR
ncbi:MAG: DUF1003 domain-containing protein [Methylibium sp.]|nr:DUF1003 domain-containing protein [Methylibium sp.]